jgi:hypothetical protein
MLSDASPPQCAATAFTLPGEWEETFGKRWDVFVSLMYVQHGIVFSAATFIGCIRARPKGNFHTLCTLILLVAAAGACCRLFRFGCFTLRAGLGRTGAPVRARSVRRWSGDNDVPLVCCVRRCSEDGVAAGSWRLPEYPRQCYALHHDTFTADPVVHLRDAVHRDVVSFGRSARAA